MIYCDTIVLHATPYSSQGLVRAVGKYQLNAETKWKEKSIKRHIFQNIKNKRNALLDMTLMLSTALCRLVHTHTRFKDRQLV